MLRRILAVVMLAAIVFAACIELGLPNARERQDSPPPASLSLLYREAELILLCTCVRTGEDENGLSRFKVDEVVDGAYPIDGVGSGGMFSLSAAADAGAKYLLYLRRSEENGGLECLTDPPIPYEHGVLTYENESFTLESVENDIERQKKILTVPSRSFFYGDFDELVNACDEIVLGRAVCVSEPTPTMTRSVLKGETTISTQNEVFLTVRVENGLYGGLRCGDRLEVVLPPLGSTPVINANDLSAKTVEAPSTAAPEVGQVYIFFLIMSEDRKSSYYFTVNPYEGFVRVISDAVTRPYYNDALRGIVDLKLFSQRLRESLAKIEE